MKEVFMSCRHFYLDSNGLSIIRSEGGLFAHFWRFSSIFCENPKEQSQNKPNLKKKAISDILRIYNAMQAIAQRLGLQALAQLLALRGLVHWWANL